MRDLDRVLAALGDRTAWEKARYLMTPWPYLWGRTPLDTLRDDVGDASDRERAIHYARYAGEMGV